MAPERSKAWDHVTTVSPAAGASGLKTVKCKFCLTEFKTNNATRISRHLEGCKFFNRNVQLAKTPSTNDKGKSVAPQDVAIAFASAAASTSGIEDNGSTRKYMKITDWAGKISESEKNACDKELALAFFSGGVPFRFIENSHLQRAMSILRPGYVPPSRRQLSNRMLDSCYSSLQEDMNAEISKASYMSIATDAWTNVHGESIINFIVLLSKPIFFEAVYSADNSHSADYLAATTGQIIRKLGADKVVSVVMDNAAANVSAAKKLENEFKETPLTCIGCAAHWVNLLAKDITDIMEYRSILSQAVQVIKTFTLKRVVSEKLSQIQVTLYDKDMAFQVPIETRWMSHCNALKSIIDSKAALQQFCVHPELSNLLNGDKESQVKKNVLLDEFWIKVTELRAQLEPLSGVILQLEKNNGMLFSVYGQFQILSSFYSSSTLPNASEVLDLFRNRWFAYFTPAVAIAHLLHPGNIDGNVDSALIEKAEQYIRQMFDEAVAPKMTSSLWCYLSKTDGFTEEAFEIFAAGTPPLVWWTRARFGSQHEELRSLAIKLLHVPATSATAERNWSAFRFIHTRLRNRLAAPKVKKLVYVFENTKAVTSDPFDDGLESLASFIDDDED